MQNHSLQHFMGPPLQLLPNLSSVRIQLCEWREPAAWERSEVQSLPCAENQPSLKRPREVKGPKVQCPDLVICSRPLDLCPPIPGQGGTGWVRRMWEISRFTALCRGVCLLPPAKKRGAGHKGRQLTSPTWPDAETSAPKPEYQPEACLLRAWGQGTRGWG